LIVDLTVTDAVEIAAVIASFDVNGDGDTQDAGESISAALVSGDHYRASFAPLGGSPWSRRLEILATDTSFNTRPTSITLGVGGVGGGESVILSQSGEIPGQPSVFNGGTRQRIPFSGIVVPGVGRLTLNVWSSPPVRRQVQNIERHDAKVAEISFGGQTIALTPVCNDPGSDPAFCSAVWDSPSAGTLDFEIIGPAAYNIWGEFQATPDQDYEIEIIFQPGPSVTTVSPSGGAVGGHEPVTVQGSGFGHSAVVLFGDIPATQVTRVSAEKINCQTPPGIAGSVAVRVLNQDIENQSWNYGRPWGLFGEKANAFTYGAASPPPALSPERLLTTSKGRFEAKGQDDSQGTASGVLSIPGPGRVRFETYAFIPIINPIAGPFENPEDLLYHNTSSSVPRFNIGGSLYSAAVEFSDLSFAFGPVIANSTRVVTAGQSGSGTFTVTGPARWNAFWRQFGDFVMLGAPAQDWSTAVWFADQPTLNSLSPTTGTTLGGERITLQGNHFAEGIQVRFGDRYATNVTLLSPSSLLCDVPSNTEGVTDVTLELLGMTAPLASGYRYTPGDEDADGDGLNILVERFMGLDPNQHDSEGAIEANVDGSTFCFVYRRARDPQGIYGIPEWSSDLVQWSSAGIIESTHRDEAGEDFTLIKAAITLPETAVMMRLRVVESN
jgi:hypothetical protein